MSIIENRKKFFILSGIIMLLGLAVVIFNIVNGNEAFNYDVEFAGGVSINVDIGEDFTEDEIAEIVTDATGETSPQIQKISNDDGTYGVNIVVKEISEEGRADLVDELTTTYDISSEDIDMNYKSPTISSEMRSSAIMAMLVASILMLIYVTFRFSDIKMGAAAITALVHDAIMVILVYAVFRLPLNYYFIVAVLTILGYSINSTIVIFDRIRENKKFTKLSQSELINKSIKQTFRRSVYTSITTLLPLVCMLIFGVTSIQEFAIPLIIGVIIGTYSSVCLSGSLWYTFTNWKK